MGRYRLSSIYLRKKKIHQSLKKLPTKDEIKDLGVPKKWQEKILKLTS